MKSVYKFDEYTLDPDSRVLKYAGRTVELEPKVFDFILLLVEERNRTVSKSEFARRLWSGGEVTDAMLNRCAYQARKMFRNTGNSKSYIKAKYGVGYRFDGEIASPENQINPINFEDTFDRIKPPPRKQQKKGVGTVTEHQIRLGLSQLTFDHANSNPSFRKVGFNAILRCRLGKLDGVTILSIPVNIPSADAINRKLLLEEYQLDYLVSGEITISENNKSSFLNVYISSESADDNSGVPLGCFELSYLRNCEIHSISTTYRDRIIQEIECRVAGSIGKLPKEAGGTDCSKAFRLRLEATNILSERSEREGQVAQALLEQALHLDPNYSDAWAELGWCYYERCWAGGDGRIWADLALNAVDKAREINPNCVFANCTKVIYQTELGATESAVALARKCINNAPEVAEYWYAMSYVLRYMGKLKESQIALDRTIKLNPYVLAEIGDPPIGLVYNRKWSRFLELMPAFDSPHFCYYRGYALWELGKGKDALEELKRGIRDDPKDNFSRLSRALIYIIEKNYEKADAVLKKLIRQRDLLNPGDCEFTYKEAKLLVLAGKFDLAVDRLKRSFDGGFNSRFYSQTDPRFKPIHTHPRYLDFIEQPAQT